jgi:hypothetical protein
MHLNPVTRLGIMEQPMKYLAFLLLVIVVAMSWLLTDALSDKRQFANSCILEVNANDGITLEIANTPFCNKYIQQ